MQALKRHWGFVGVLAYAFFFFSCLLAEGCGWQRTMTFASPSRKATVEIWQPRLANELGTRLELVSAQRRTVLYERRGEMIIYFVHVYWSPDETKLGVLATGFTILNVAFDVKSGKEISFEQIRAECARSIRDTYNLPAKENDPIQWAAMADAQTAFFKLHPEIRLSYH